MTAKVRHQFVSPKGDGPDTSLVRPSNWNADHEMTMVGPKLLGRSAASEGAVGEIGLGAGLGFSGSNLQITLGSPPIGCVLDYAGASAPSGWLFCYGQAVSRTTYAALFAAISTTFGTGNGSSTFNLPDCRGRVSAGKDNMGGTAAGRLTHSVSGGVTGSTLGAVGGEQAHALTEDELASHDHSGTTASAGSHSHLEFSATAKTDPSPTLAPTDAPAWKNASSNNADYAIQGDTGGGAATLGASSTSGSHAHSFDTNVEGSDAPHNNVQPTIVFNKIIYAGV